MANFDWVPLKYKDRFSYVDGKLVASCQVCGDTRQTSGKGAVLRDIDRGLGGKFLMCGLHGNYKGTKPSKADVISWPIGHKRCRTCKTIKPFEQFHAHAGALFGFDVVCKNCRVPISKNEYSSRTAERLLWERAKGRTRENGREFTISVKDIRIPDFCPILGIKLEKIVGNTKTSPSLDRIDPKRGYTPDNIMVISARANTLKNDMTYAEAKLIVDFLRTLRDN